MRTPAIPRSGLFLSLRWFFITPWDIWRVSSQFFSLSGLYCVCSALAVVALLGVTNSSISIGSLAEPTVLIATLSGLHVVYTRWRPDPIISSLTFGLLVVTWSGFVAGLLSLIGLRVNAPLIDAKLAHIDTVLHVNTPAIVAWFADYPLTSHALDLAYISAVPLAFGSVAYLALVGRGMRMRELAFTFLGCSTICAGLSAILPAEGAFVHYGTPLDVLARLPAGAGVFHLPVFNAYRSSNLSIIDLRDLSGLVTFPSFHACMALMVAYSMRDKPGLSAVAWLWACVVLVSTIPIGGHYAADVLAGAMLWSAFALSGAAIAKSERTAARTGP